MSQAIEQQVAQALAEELPNAVIEMPSEIERRQSILTRDIAHQEAREVEALAALKSELSAVKIARALLRDRETAARAAYANLVEITDALARASRAALKELG